MMIFFLRGAPPREACDVVNLVYDRSAIDYQMFHSLR